MITIYGIKTCDTMKKARAWLDAHGIAYVFHDYRASGVDRSWLDARCREHGWEVLLNRVGTTFRALPDEEKAGLDARKAMKLMLAQPAMIKRPVLDLGDRSIVGFRPELYEAIAGQKNTPRAGGRARGARKG